MSDKMPEESEGTISSGSTGREPIVELDRIVKIQTHEVQAMELERLDDLVATENTKLAATTFVAGVFVAALLGWLAAEKLTPTASAVHIAIIIATGILMPYFAIDWIRARRERPRLLATIRGRSKTSIAAVR